MRNHSTLFLVIVLLAASSCVPIKKILYLQKEGDLKKKFPNDTILRTYDLGAFDYKVQTNDIINVRYATLTEDKYDFLNQEQTTAGGGGSTGGGAGNYLMRGELVDDKGEIPVPYVGRIKVAGLTVYQIQDTIQQLANLYLESPIVKVRLLNYRATILGEVNGEGVHTFGQNRVTLMEAIALAGGLGEFADRAHIKVIRQTNSKTEVYYVNLLKEDFMNSPYYYVHQNDIIIVQALKQRTFRKYFLPDVAILLSAASVVLLIVALNRSR